MRCLLFRIFKSMHHPNLMTWMRHCLRVLGRKGGDFLGSAWIQVSDQATCACALGFAVREAWSRFEGLILIPIESYWYKFKEGIIVWWCSTWFAWPSLLHGICASGESSSTWILWERNLGQTSWNTTLELVYSTIPYSMCRVCRFVVVALYCSIHSIQCAVKIK